MSSSTEAGPSGRTADSSKHATWLAGGVIAVASVGAYLVYSRRTAAASRSRAKAAPQPSTPERAEPACPANAPEQPRKNEISVLMPALDMPVPPTPFEAAMLRQQQPSPTPFAAASELKSPADSETSQDVQDRLQRYNAGKGSMDIDLNSSCRSTRSARAPSSDLDCAISIPDILKSRNAGNATLEIGAMLGRGSFGKVYKGRWRGAMVAIKVIEHTADAGSKLDGLREALLCSNIQHPNVLISYKVIRKNAKGSQLSGQMGSLDSAKGSSGHKPSDGSPWQAVPPKGPSEASGKQQEPSEDEVHETWIISEYCDKGNLDRAVLGGRFHNKETKAPNLVAIYRCLLDIAAGMGYLHSLGVLHGDLKGGNVLLKSTSTFDDPRGFQCKIGDFGLSRVLETDTAHVTTNTYGTVSYCGPEVLKEGKLTRAADVYSFSMMMWEIWMGEGLFRGLNSSQVFFKVMMGYRPPVPEGMPQGYCDLMTACWAEDPTQRPPFEDIERFIRTLYYAASASDGGRSRDSRRSLELNPWG